MPKRFEVLSRKCNLKILRKIIKKSDDDVDDEENDDEEEDEGDAEEEDDAEEEEDDDDDDDAVKDVEEDVIYDSLSVQLSNFTKNFQNV